MDKNIIQQCSRMLSRLDGCSAFKQGFWGFVVRGTEVRSYDPSIGSLRRTQS